MEKTVCIFSALYEPHVGGVENFTKELSAELLRKGFRVLVVTSNHAGLPKKTSSQSGLTIYHLPCISLFNDRLPLPKKNAEFRQLMHELKNETIDYICINTRFYPHSLIGAKFAKKKGIRPIVIEHGSDYLTFGKSVLDPTVKLYEHFMTHRLKRFKPRFFAVSRRSSEWLSTFGITSCGEIHNAIEADSFCKKNSGRDFRAEFQLPTDAQIVAFVGRLTPEKGIEQLVDAAKILSSRSDIAFLIAGAGPLRKPLEARASLNTHFLGSLSQPDIVALLHSADILCLPSRSEGFATVLLEAAACSAVPLVTNVGGVEELVINEEYGVVLPDRDPDTIAQALETLCNDRELTRKRALNINNLVKKNYNWQETAEKLVAAFEEDA